MSTKNFTIKIYNLESATEKPLWESQIEMTPSKNVLKDSLEKVWGFLVEQDSLNTIFKFSVECENGLGHMVGDVVAWINEIHFSLWDTYHEKLGFLESIGKTYPVKNAEKIPIYASFLDDTTYIEITQEKPQPKNAAPFQAHSPLYNIEGDVVLDTGQETPYDKDNPYEFDIFASDIYESVEKHGETVFYLRLRCEPATSTEHRGVFYMRDISYNATMADASILETIEADEDDEYMVVLQGTLVYDDERYAFSMPHGKDIQDIDGALYSPDMGGFSTEFAEEIATYA